STSMIGQQASDPSLVDYLTRQTEGNAFFLVEVVRELAEQAGRLSDIPAMTLPERVVSEGVQSIVRRSLNRVPAEHRDLLKVAAVLGRRIEPPVLRALATTNLEGWIGICTAASVLEASGDVIRFAHDKLREGLIDSLEQGEYRALHKQAARALERHYASDPDQAARLALHWQAAGDPAKERQYTARAAEYANRLGASREAVRLYRRMLALTPTAQARSHTRVLIDLGRSLDSIAEFDEARTILEKALTQAQTLGETGWQVEILDTLGNTLYMLNEQDQAAAYLNQALAILPAGSSPVVRAGLLTGLGRIAWQRGDYATMLQADKAYLAALRQEGASADKIGSALNNLGFSALHMEAYDEAIAALKECLAVIDETNDAVLNVVAELNLAEVYRRTRQPQQAWPHVRAGLLGYTVHDLDFLAIEALAIAAGLFAIEGRLEQAAHLYAQLHQHDSIDVELRTLLDNVKADIIEHAGAETFNQLLAGIPAADLPALVDTMLARIGPSTG
ncbi:MAG: tetratricopeptide repeat protein, partial [Chloroflexi bacterium]|nr:tetratricopeptide repeat protein [Chloroflexota bacterium]